jgi:predicted nucleotidyltransferase component of viral defense system
MVCTLQEHVERAMAATSNELAQPVILKEILHYEILQALSASDLADRLVFQGGTALRACYSGTRLSEDLDFVCGSGSPEPLNVAKLEELLRASMQARYGIGLDAVAGPNTVLGDGVGVKRWTFKLKVPWQAQMQRINFEVCNVPSMDAAPQVIRSPYPHQHSLQGIVMLVESREEIYSDKLVALALRTHLKARDVWDVHFLSQQGVRPNYEWVAQKVADYGRTDEDFVAGIDAAIFRLQEPSSQDAFAKEMSRFLDSRMAGMFIALKAAYPEVAAARDGMHLVELDMAP